jgi:acyl carrier protein
MTSKMTDISAALIGYITEQLLNNRPGSTLAPGDDLLGSELLDSLGVMRLVQFIEQRFDIRVPPEDVTIQNFATVHSMDAYLRSRGI